MDCKRVKQFVKAEKKRSIQALKLLLVTNWTNLNDTYRINGVIFASVVLYEAKNPVLTNVPQKKHTANQTLSEFKL